MNGDIIRDSLGPAIDVIATSRPTQVVSVIDLYTPFVGLQSLAPDGVHPNKAGQDSIARKVHRALLPIVTSLAPARDGGFGRAVPGVTRRVHLTGGRAPEWMWGKQVSSVSGKTVRIGANGALPAGVYYVKPNAARVGAGK
jgi:hypothetical protein